MLFFCASDGIMMLHHADCLLEEVKFLTSPRGQDAELTQRFEQQLSLPDHPLGGGP